MKPADALSADAIAAREAAIAAADLAADLAAAALAAHGAAALAYEAANEAANKAGAVAAAARMAANEAWTDALHTARIAGDKKAAAIAAADKAVFSLEVGLFEFGAPDDADFAELADAEAVLEALERTPRGGR